VIVRPFSEADGEPVLAFFREARRAAYGFVPIHQSYTEADDRGFFFERLVATQELWVAERDAAPVGFIALNPGWVDQLFVAIGAQRTGVGSALIEHAMAQAEGELRLYTFQKNTAARAFYARHRFAEIELGVSPAPESEPDVLLLWRPASP
jgi:GNAT superfamily N-acetyltransferase